MRYLNILAAVVGTPWAIVPAKGEAIAQFLAFAAMGGKHDPDSVEAIVGPRRHRLDVRIDARGADPVAIRAAIDAELAVHQAGVLHAGARQAGAVQAVETGDGGEPGRAVAVLSLAGIISPRLSAEMDISSGGGTSAEGFARRLRAAVDDPRIGGIVIDVDSPGGNVLGVAEASQALFDARASGKPIVAVANHMACSAAYHLAVSAGELAMTPSAEVGSIGVYTFHESIAKKLEMEGRAFTLVKAGPHKAEQFPAFALTDDTRAHIQSRVDAYYGAFVRDVARGRGIPASEVEGRFGGGRAVGAEDALAAGMVDRISTLDDEIARMADRIRPARSSAAPSGGAQVDRRRRAALW